MRGVTYIFSGGPWDGAEGEPQWWMTEDEALLDRCVPHVMMFGSGPGCYRTERIEQGYHYLRWHEGEYGWDVCTCEPEPKREPC